MRARSGKVAALTVYTSDFGMGRATFGYTFCHTPVAAKRRARQEAYAMVKELFSPLFGNVAEAKKKIWVGEPLIVRVADTGLPEDERQAITRGKDGVVFMSWLEDVMEPMLMCEGETKVGSVHIYER